MGIVIVHYNAPQHLSLTLNALRYARCKTSFHIYPIDGGSNSGNKAHFNKITDDFAHYLRISKTTLDQNLGYSGNNNVGISQATITDKCSHICLLNSDVEVTNDWLDLLLLKGELVVSGVSNAVGNEQTVPITYRFKDGESAFYNANRFSRNWRDAFQEKVCYTAFLGFFCVLIRTDIIRAIGELDNSFFPGGFEDLDYCVRLRKAGLSLAIARHVYLHHWGSASFSKLSMADRLQYVSDNQRRYEDKHRVPWIDWKYRIFQSWVDDAKRKKTAAF